MQQETSASSEKKRLTWKNEFIANFNSSKSVPQPQQSGLGEPSQGADAYYCTCVMRLASVNQQSSTSLSYGTMIHRTPQQYKNPLIRLFI